MHMRILTTTMRVSLAIPFFEFMLRSGHDDEACLQDQLVGRKARHLQRVQKLGRVQLTMPDIVQIIGTVEC